MAQVNIGMRVQKSVFNPTYLAQCVCTPLVSDTQITCFVHKVGVIMRGNQAGFKYAWLAGDNVRQNIRTDVAGSNPLSHYTFI